MEQAPREWGKAVARAQGVWEARVPRALAGIVCARNVDTANRISGVSLVCKKNVRNAEQF